MAGSMWQSKAVHFMETRKERETGRGWSPNIPFKGTPLMT
jgi:hypothetical protein